MRYDAAGNEYSPEDVLDAEELADYYDTKGINWRRRPTPSWTVYNTQDGAA